MLVFVNLVLFRGADSQFRHDGEYLCLNCCIFGLSGTNFVSSLTVLVWQKDMNSKAHGINPRGDYPSATLHLILVKALCKAPTRPLNHKAGSDTLRSMRVKLKSRCAQDVGQMHAKPQLNVPAAR